MQPTAVDRPSTRTKVEELISEKSSQTKVTHIFKSQQRGSSPRGFDAGECRHWAAIQSRSGPEASGARALTSLPFCPTRGSPATAPQICTQREIFPPPIFGVTLEGAEQNSGSGRVEECNKIIPPPPLPREGGRKGAHRRESSQRYIKV